MEPCSVNDASVNANPMRSDAAALAGLLRAAASAVFTVRSDESKSKLPYAHEVERKCNE
jgi:hypothetical protein